MAGHCDAFESDVVRAQAIGNRSGGMSQLSLVLVESTKTFIPSISFVGDFQHLNCEVYRHDRRRKPDIPFIIARRQIDSFCYPVQ